MIFRLNSKGGPKLKEAVREPGAAPKPVCLRRAKRVKNMPKRVKNGRKCTQTCQKYAQTCQKHTKMHPNVSKNGAQTYQKHSKMHPNVSKID